MKILNLSGTRFLRSTHGKNLVELDSKDEALLKSLGEFDGTPTVQKVNFRARVIATMAVHEGAAAAMVGGPPFMVDAIVEALKLHGVAPLFPDTRKEAARVKYGSSPEIIDVNIRCHVGFILAQSSQPTKFVG